MIKTVYGIVNMSNGEKVYELTVNTEKRKTTKENINYYEKAICKNGYFPVTMTIIESNVFDSLEQAEQELTRRANIAKAKIEENIKSADDLIKDMFKTIRYSEYIDCNQVEVYKQKIKEYFNINSI